MIAQAVLHRFARPTGSAAEELELCRRIAAGEKHLFSQIVDQYGGMVAAVIAAQGAQPADIEDLAQLAFVNVYRGLAGFRGQARLSSWIYRIALNVARGALKRAAGREQPASLESAAEAGFSARELSAGADQRWLHRSALRTAMLRLAEPQRIALSLFYYEELSYEEIAAAMRLNVNTVRTHIRRGKLRLAELLDPELLA